MHRVRPPKHPNMRSLEEINIRQAESGDVAGIRQCLVAAFEPYRAQYTAGAYLDTVPDEVSILQRVQNMHVLVAVAPEGIVGTVGALLGNDAGHVRGMAVRPEWRSTGLSAL